MRELAETPDGQGVGGNYPAKFVMDKPVAGLSEYGKMISLCAAVASNGSLRSQFDQYRSHGDGRATEAILSEGKKFRYKGFARMDHTEGKTFLASDGRAFWRPCHEDPVFTVTGEDQAIEILANGKVAKRFPEVTPVCMETSDSPVGWIWTADCTGNWQHELGEYIRAMAKKGAPPDPRRFLDWKTDRSHKDWFRVTSGWTSG